jgi:hypothetical protein
MLVLELLKGPLELLKGPLELLKGPLELLKGPLVPALRYYPGGGIRENIARILSTDIHPYLVIILFPGNTVLVMMAAHRCGHRRLPWKGDAFHGGLLPVHFICTRIFGTFGTCQARYGSERV